jgi:hypothetical protein
MSQQRRNVLLAHVRSPSLLAMPHDQSSKGCARAIHEKASTAARLAAAPAAAHHASQRPTADSDTSHAWAIFRLLIFNSFFFAASQSLKFITTLPPKTLCHLANIVPEIPNIGT